MSRVLFVCVHNAGRSQMAAALLDHHAHGRVVVRSAGTAPADEINPAVIAAMDEIGIDLVAAGAHPKSLSLEWMREHALLVYTVRHEGDMCDYLPRLLGGEG